MERLSAEYLTIAAKAQNERWDAMLEGSTLSEEQRSSVRACEAYGPLQASLRYAEARGIDLEAVFPRLVAGRSLADAGDVAAVLQTRVDRWVQVAAGRHGSSDNLIVGLIPKAQGVTDIDLAKGLAERELAMEQRARALAIAAIESEAEWVKQCGSMPTAAGSRVRWSREISTVAAYRDRWHVSAQGPIDDRSQVASAEQMRQRGRARVAAERAAVIGRDPHVHRTDSVSIPQMKVGPDVDLAEV